MLAQCSASLMCSLKTRFTKSSIFEIGLAIFPFHHECNVFCAWPVLPRCIGPREYSALIHLHATLLSPPCCTVGLSSRVWMVVFSLTFPLLLLFLCTVDSFTLSSATVTNFVHISKCAFYFPFSHPFFFTCPVRSNFISHVSTIVSSPLMLPSCTI